MFLSVCWWYVLYCCRRGQLLPGYVAMITHSAMNIDLQSLLP